MFLGSFIFNVRNERASFMKDQVFLVRRWGWGVVIEVIHEKKYGAGTAE